MATTITDRPPTALSGDGYVITTGDASHCTVVRVTGRFDWTSAADFRAKVREALGYGPVVVDISDARCDAAGNGALMGAAFEVNSAGQAMAVVTVDELERAVLDKIGLDRVVPVYDSIDEALASVLPVPRAS